MIKILWLTSFPLPDLTSALGKTSAPICGWLGALAGALATNGEIELAVASNVPRTIFTKKKICGVQHYAIPMPKDHVNGRRLPKSLIIDYQRALKDFQPDLIHVHGTEFYHGLLTGRGHLERPTVISLQGIIDAYVSHYFGSISRSAVLKSRTLRDYVRFDGLVEQKYRWHKRAEWEREIFATHSHFVGRTLWDQAQLRRLNPRARYYHGGEALRAVFYTKTWRREGITRHSIFAPSAAYPLKGFHVLVKAVALLRSEFPNITVRSPLAHFYPTLTGVKRLWKNCRSTGYAKYLTDLIRSKGLEKHIVGLPAISANEMVGELSKANAFVLPSFIENSPNSLCEAMLVGTPCITSYVGGVPSLVRDEQTALVFPSGDEAVLAEQIRRLFLDPQLGEQLSAKARSTARSRHSHGQIVGDMLRIYKSVITHGPNGDVMKTKPAKSNLLRRTLG
jgi:glycosyltransferase involved in cell wall biosynthesis